MCRSLLTYFDIYVNTLNLRSELRCWMWHCECRGGTQVKCCRQRLLARQRVARTSGTTNISNDTHMYVSAVVCCSLCGSVLDVSALRVPQLCQHYVVSKETYIM